jgi:hypothetical protein
MVETASAMAFSLSDPDPDPEELGPPAAGAAPLPRFLPDIFVCLPGDSFWVVG